MEVFWGGGESKRGRYREIGRGRGRERERENENRKESVKEGAKSLSLNGELSFYMSRTLHCNTVGG